jgi:hypothetical protein
MAENETVLGPVAKLAVTARWIIGSAFPSFLLVVLEVPLRSSSGADASGFLLPLLWCLTAGLSAPSYARALGHVEAGKALPPPERALHHLPPTCARWVEEAQAIRADLQDHERALQRAWELSQELERATPDERMFIELSGATLQPVHELLRLHASRSRPSEAQLRERLDAVLARFEAALAQPKSAGFR